MFNERFDYWRPQFKFQLVDFFVKQNILTQAKAKSMNKNNLFGKYCEIRRREVLIESKAFQKGVK